tara:strand:- start:1770 stop:2513 length:744 start_codon:yes stop_codon:yes gene_type:complete
MKIDVGLIGSGTWGTKIKFNLKKIANLKFICNSSQNYLNEIKKNKVKWVFIATPNKTHYEIVKNCLNKEINVYCEKPLCLSHAKAKILVELSKKKNVKLYVSDLYDFYSKKIKKLNLTNTVYRSKLVKGPDLEFINRFMYHDINIFYKFLTKYKIRLCTFRSNKKKKIFETKIEFTNNKNINFIYNLNLNLKKHTINNINIRSKNDYLNKMIYNVLYDKYDISKNNIKALFIIDYLTLIKKRIKYAN